MKIVRYANGVTVAAALAYVAYMLYRGESPPWHGGWVFVCAIVVLLLVQIQLDSRSSVDGKDALYYIVAAVIAGVLGALFTGAVWVVFKFLDITPWVWWHFMTFGAVVFIGIRFSPLWATAGKSGGGAEK